MLTRVCVSACVAVALLSVVLCNNHGLDGSKATAAPKNPPTRPKVHCWSSVYPHKTLCSWDEPQQQAVATTHYIATYSERRRPSAIKQCRLIPPGSLNVSSVEPAAASPSPGQVWHCLLEDLKLLTDYIVNITAVHSLGSSSYLTSFMMEDIVKPDPPVDVRLSPGGSLKWSPPPTWSNLDIFPLKYLIQYQGSGKIPKMLGPYERTVLDLGLARRGRTYLLQVCAMELLDLGECSNWSKPLQVTGHRL